MVLEKEGLRNSIDFYRSQHLAPLLYSFDKYKILIDKYKNDENVLYDLCEMTTDCSLFKKKKRVYFYV